MNKKAAEVWLIGNAKSDPYFSGLDETHAKWLVEQICIVLNQEEEAGTVPARFARCQRSIMQIGQCFDCALIKVCDDPSGDKVKWERLANGR